MHRNPWISKDEFVKYIQEKKTELFSLIQHGSNNDIEKKLCEMEHETIKVFASFFRGVEFDTSLLPDKLKDLQKLYQRLGRKLLNQASNNIDNVAEFQVKSTIGIDAMKKKQMSSKKQV